MKTLKPFGPTLSKSKLSKKIIKIINNEVNKPTLITKMTIAQNFLVK